MELMHTGPWLLRDERDSNDIGLFIGHFTDPLFNKLIEVLSHVYSLISPDHGAKFTERWLP